MTQDVAADIAAVIGQASSDRKIAGTDIWGVPQDIVDAVTQAGFQATTGTIAFAGRHATGDFAVQYNDQNGGFSSVWPQWAFELAKDALLGNKRVWVASNGDPFGSNLVFVMIFP